MLRFVLQLLRSLAVLVTLLLQSWREKKVGSARTPDKLPRDHSNAWSSSSQSHHSWFSIHQL